MENYGVVLKKLIKFTNVKLSTVADLAGYDVSYISKWCNQSTLPSARVATTINKNLSSVFASEIIAQNELYNFCNEFNVMVTDDKLEDFINNYLKEAFKNTVSSSDDKAKKDAELKSKILYNQSEILRFMEIEFPKIITEGSQPTEMLCTMDISAMFSSLHSLPEEYQRNNPIRIRMGINLSTYNKKKYFDLYCMLNRYHNITFDIYDNSTFGNRNLIVVKDKVALLFSFTNKNMPSIITVIYDREIVDTLFIRTMSAFKINHLLVMASTSEELNINGYRSNFYAYDDYQIFLVRGFEYLLPPKTIEKIVAAAYEQGYDSSTEKILRTLFKRWDEISTNGKLDFFVTKSSLLKYLDDGEFYFTDIICRMDTQERKEHIEHITCLAKSNPNINFYVIDDEDSSYPGHSFVFSIFNNYNKLFLKNTKVYSGEPGPQFYTILNEKLIHDISQCYEVIKGLNMCKHFSGEKIEKFISQYGTMIYRLLSLSEIKQAYTKNVES